MTAGWSGKGWRIFVGAAIALLLAMGVVALQSSPAFASGNVNVSVQGKGNVTGPGVDCDESGGPDCSQFYSDNRVCEESICYFEDPYVEFTAGADRNGYVYDGWTNCDTVTDRVCGLTVTADRGVTARFRDAQGPSVTSLSPGSGVQRGTITLSADASDNSGSVNRVEFRVRSALVGSDSSAPYSTSFNTASVSDGSATIRATAFDAAGNSSSTESTVTIDNTAPTLTISGGPNGQAFGPGTSQTWTFSAADATSGLASVQCSVVPTGSAASYGPCSGGNSSHSVTNKPEGNYTFTVRARDNGGLETARSSTFSIDATPPDTRIDRAPPAITNQTSATFDFASTETGSTFECRVYPAGTTPGAFGNCSGTGTHTVNGLQTRDHTFDVRSVDAVGNVESAPASYTWTVDATPPVVNITDGPAQNSTSTSRSPSFSFTATDTTTVSFLCRIDNEAAFTSCTSPRTYSNLADGSHTFRVKGTDAAGNQGIEVVRLWTVDGTAPGLEITSGPQNGSVHKPGDLAWTFTASDTTSGVVSPVECKVLRVGSTALYSPCDSNSTHSVSGLSEGSYEFWVRARDGAGITAEVQRTFSIDATEPAAPTITDRPAELTNSTTASWTFSAEPGATFLCSIDSTDNFSACVSGQEFTVQTGGPHTFRVKARDQAGNIGPAAQDTWTVDATGPTIKSWTPTGKRVSPRARPTVAFSEKMDEASVEAKDANGLPTTFVLKKGATGLPATVAYTETTTGQYQAVLTPGRKLRSGATYTATVTTAAKDEAGNLLEVTKTWRFTVK